MKTSCAKELAIANRAEGFQYLLQAIEEMLSFRQEALQLMRDRYPDLRGAPEDAVLAFLKAKAGTR